MYSKQLYPHCMNMFTYLNTKHMRAGGLIIVMAQQLLCIRPFTDPGLELADSLGIHTVYTGCIKMSSQSLWW